MEAGLFKALLLAVGVATVARAGMAYLPLTGPLPLRVLAVKTPQPLPEIIPTPLAQHDPNSPAAVENCVNDTNPIVITRTPSDNLPPVAMHGRTAMEHPFGSQTRAPPHPNRPTSSKLERFHFSVAQAFQPAGAGDFPVARCQSWERGTGMSRAPADKNVCATSLMELL